MTFYLSFIAFILSIIGGVVLMLVGKNMQRDRFNLLATMHGILLLAYLASIVLKSSSAAVKNNYFFTAFICSGIFLSGLTWRTPIPKALKYYFSLFFLCIPMFLFSPSMMMNFLVSGSYSSTTGKIYHLTGRFYLEEQNSAKDNDDLPHYKVISKNGIFHKNIQRDVVFKGPVDSIKVISLEKNKMIIRGYTITKTYVSELVDSADAEIILQSTKPGQIEYRL